MARLAPSFALALALLDCNKSETTSSAPPAASASATAASMPAAPARAALRVAYSDWPGWTAFEVGIQKGWFKQAGVDVDFVWFDYLPSLEAFSANKVDAVMVTNGDALV
ncbi:MAG: ABC transporter substrate-binding protein, partial [Myxococcota bacterium]|nr:ABC transporter substrate-binding protein [Myxococcota bacterium]